jgi:hypothetical protein
MLSHHGKCCFFDQHDLQGKLIQDCAEHASRAKALICVLDDAFPTPWCLEEIQAAINSATPIYTVFDMSKFLWSEVGKEAWFNKGISHSIVRKVFERGTIHFNSHASYRNTAEDAFVSALSIAKLAPIMIMKESSTSTDDDEGGSTSTCESGGSGRRSRWSDVA